MTPAIDCSTGVHSIPNPGVGWIVGRPIILIVGEAGGKENPGDRFCWLFEFEETDDRPCS